MKILISLAMVLALNACSAQQNNNGNESSAAQNSSNATYTDVNNEEAKKLINQRPNLQIIDVRTNGEVAQGMIPGAKQIDFSKSTFESEIAKLDRNAPVLVYCAAGGRSASAQEQMQEMGFKEVYNLSQGYEGWE